MVTGVGWEIAFCGQLMISDNYLRIHGELSKTTSYRAVHLLLSNGCISKIFTLFVKHLIELVLLI